MKIKTDFLRAMYHFRILPCPMGTARGEDPFGKGLFFTKLAEFLRHDGMTEAQPHLV
ncbi:hypothetical protein [Aquibacillus sediminis]|uniref:hypothetical protein n=1 Tax=Aquibacillus sediminis TaxID=2574734 RepID=UPI001486393A|nr:hypothetical protein [Aquibacillus sediminis]